MLDAEFSGLVVSFDGAAKLKTQSGSCGFVVWKLPDWIPIHAEGIHLTGATVNEAEYHGLRHGLRYLQSAHGVREIVVAGDSRIVVQQCQGIINYNSANLQVLLNQYNAIEATFPSVRLVHVKREFNATADYLTGKVIRLGAAVVISDPDELDQLAQLNRLPARISSPAKNPANPPEMMANEQVANVEATRERPDEAEDLSLSSAIQKVVPRTSARSTSESVERDGDGCDFANQVFAIRTRSRPQVDPLGVDAVEVSAPERHARAIEVHQVEVDVDHAVAERWNRIRVHQRADPEYGPLIRFLSGDLDLLSEREAVTTAKVASEFEIDNEGTLRYAGARPGSRSRGDTLRLVVPPAMRTDVLHLHHDDLQGGYQGVNRTYERIRSEYYRRGLFKDVERHVRECIDCSTSKGAAPNPGPSRGNVGPNCPMQIISMDFVIPLPASRQGNTALLLFQDMFSGYVMSKAMRDTTAQAIAEAYEEAVFRRFGASSILRHDRDPQFMSDMFRHFARMMGSQQRATLAYRPQANGQQERSVQTMIRSIRSYVEEPGQEDWEDLAGRLTFALNTSRDCTRLETPFFLMHGWDAKTTMAAMLAPKPANRAEKMHAYAWRIQVQRQYQHTQAAVRDLQRKAQGQRAKDKVAAWKDLPDKFKAGLEVGDAVWLYMTRVRNGLTKKLAHHWHGPFRIVEKRNDMVCRLEIQGSPYRVNPWVHIGRLKPLTLFEKRPSEVPANLPDSADLDALLIPEDSWEPDNAAGEYEVEALLNVRWGRTRAGRRVKEYHVQWAGYRQPTWEPVHRLHCGRLLYEFDRSARGRARFAAMQVDEAGEDDGG